MLVEAGTVIGALGALIAGLAAWRNAKAANHAVNCRDAEHPTIAEQVDRIAGDVGDVKTDLLSVRSDLSAHLIYHHEHAE